MRAFNFTSSPARIVFGVGRRGELTDEVRALGCARVLVLSTPEQGETAQAVFESLGELAAGIFDGARMHTPVVASEQAVALARDKRADAVVAVGGGSTIGLGKAISLRTGLPQVAIPTTYAGSEVTPIIGETDRGIKRTQRTDKVLPRTVIYDPELTLSLPLELSVTSGINAIAHAAEALYARDGNPIIAMMAAAGLKAMAAALPRIRESAHDIEARSDALYGAWLCGTCLGSVAMALHHKLCHVLGGLADLPHAETHTIMLPHSLAYNAAAAPEAMATIAGALGGADAPQAVFELVRRLEGPTALKQIGMDAASVDRAVELTLRDPYWNPELLERDKLTRLIRRAYDGDAPES